ncbi:MAG: hypothetical protein ACI90G_002538, partial [Urechidicola sp.]
RRVPIEQGAVGINAIRKDFSRQGLVISHCRGLHLLFACNVLYIQF